MNEANPLSLRTLRRFLDLAGSRLDGEWILLGGTVLPLLGVEYRVTADIDLVNLRESQSGSALRLMELAEKLGLPIESINQAAAYFLHKIPKYQKHLVLLHQGKSATLYRPDAYLFVRLKLGRLSESDLSDCIEFIKLEKKNEKSISESEKKELMLLLRKELSKKEQNENRMERLQQLQRTLTDA